MGFFLGKNSAAEPLKRRVYWGSTCVQLFLLWALQLWLQCHIRCKHRSSGGKEDVWSVNSRQGEKSGCEWNVKGSNCMKLYEDSTVVVLNRWKRICLRKRGHLSFGKLSYQNQPLFFRGSRITPTGGRVVDEKDGCINFRVWVVVVVLLVVVVKAGGMQKSIMYSLYLNVWCTYIVYHMCDILWNSIIYVYFWGYHILSLLYVHTWIYGQQYNIRWKWLKDEMLTLKIIGAMLRSASLKGARPSECCGSGSAANGAVSKLRGDVGPGLIQVYFLWGNQAPL